MSAYVSKDGVYHRINFLRKELEITSKNYPLNVRSLCEKTKGIALRSIPLDAQGLRGVAVLSHDKSDDIILLNSNRSKTEQNFDCGHELYHIAFHRNAGDTFNCLEHVKPCQNSFLEWQANEGSAEFIVPYRMLLPKIKKSLSTLKEWHDYYQFKHELANYFDVSEAVINFRFESLKYEICQYIHGSSINGIKLCHLRNSKKTESLLNH